MSAQSRRTFLARSAAICAATKVSLADPLSQRNLGVQLYTVRKIIGKDPAGVLKQIHDIGYGEIEATADTLKSAWSAIESSGLKATSVHLNTSPTDEELADAKSKGFEYAV